MDDSSPSLLCSDCWATKAPTDCPGLFSCTITQEDAGIFVHLEDSSCTDRSWLIFTDRPDFFFFFLTVHRCIYTRPICLTFCSQTFDALLKHKALGKVVWKNLLCEMPNGKYQSRKQRRKFLPLPKMHSGWSRKKKKKQSSWTNMSIKIIS